MFAFKYTSSERDREWTLGTQAIGFQEFEPQIVFTKNGRIVYQESEPTSIEHPIKNEVVFDIPDDAYFKAYSPGAVFSVIEESGPDGSYFYLKQVQ